MSNFRVSGGTSIGYNGPLYWVQFRLHKTGELRNVYVHIDVDNRITDHCAAIGFALDDLRREIGGDVVFFQRLADIEYQYGVHVSSTGVNARLPRDRVLVEAKRVLMDELGIAVYARQGAVIVRAIRDIYTAPDTTGGALFAVLGGGESELLQLNGVGPKTAEKAIGALLNFFCELVNTDAGDRLHREAILDEGINPKLLAKGVERINSFEGVNGYYA